jgi:Domain of unknown function (DUF5658)
MVSRRESRGEDLTLNQLILQYSYLQMLDFLTTIAFLLHGVGEGNPMVRAAMDLAPHPMLGLMFVKAAAMCLGLYCWRFGRNQILGRINILFAVVVAWNLAALIMGSVETVR